MLNNQLKYNFLHTETQRRRDTRRQKLCVSPGLCAPVFSGLVMGANQIVAEPSPAGTAGWCVVCLPVRKLKHTVNKVSSLRDFRTARTSALHRQKPPLFSSVLFYARYRVLIEAAPKALRRHPEEHRRANEE